MTERITMKIFAPICYSSGQCEAIYVGCDICGASDELNAAYYERDDISLFACQQCIRAGQIHLDWRLRKHIAKREAHKHTPPYPKDKDEFFAEFRADTETLRTLIGRITIPSWDEWKASSSYSSYLHAMSAE